MQRNELQTIEKDRFISVKYFFPEAIVAYAARPHDFPLEHIGAFVVCVPRKKPI